MPEVYTDTYLTIENASKGLFKDKGSKFFAFAYPVSTEPIIKEHLDLLRKEYFDARHHCYAYRLGVDMKNFRIFDDGEPSNSAGKPILGQIVAHNLTDILIVVIRYFGGTLLGVGGLIQAYKTASMEAISNATIVSKEITDTLKLKFDYPLQNQVNRLIKEYNISIIQSKFDFDCQLTVQCRKNSTNQLLSKFKELIYVNISLNENIDL